MPPAPIPGVILAGGRGLRLGGADKGLILLHKKPMLWHVLDRLAPQIEPVALNANGPADRFAEFGLLVLPDPLPGHPGPLAGILAAMEWAASLGCAHVVTHAADTPFLPADLVARLTHAADASVNGLALAATGGGCDWHPTTGIWPVALQDPLRRALQNGQRKVLAFAQDHGAAPALFEAEAFFNVNTPDDLETARQRMGRA